MALAPGKIWKLARSGAAVSIVSLYLGVVCNLALTFFAGWWFGEHVFGYIVIGLSVVLIGSMLGQFGFSHGLVKLIGAYRATGDIAYLKGAIRGVTWFCTGTGVVFGVIGALVVLLPIPMDAELRPALLWSMACVPVWTLMLLQQHVARGFQRMGLANLPSTVVHPLLLMGAIWLLSERDAATAAFFFRWYAILGMGVVLGLGLWVRLLPEMRELRGVRPGYAMKQWLVMSFPIGVSNVLNQLMQRADALILAMFVTPAQVGLYGMAARIAMGVGQCKLAFNRYWASDMAGRWEVRDLDGLRHVVKRTGRLTMVVSVSIALVLIVFGRWILKLPGEAFVAAYPLMMILLVGHLMMAYFAANITLLQMADQERTATRNYAVALVVMVAGYFVAVPVWGAIGAAVVTSAGTVLLSSLMTRSCVKRLDCYPGAF